MSEGVFGLILAGGQSRRMGAGDKCLMELGGKSLLAHVKGRLEPQCADIALSVNGDPQRFGALGLPTVVDDGALRFAGPLAGVLAGLDHAAMHRPDMRWLVTVPADTPFIPHDLVQCLAAACAAEGAVLALAASNGRLHPVVGLWPLHLRDGLRSALVDGGIRRVDRFTAHHRTAVVEWPATPVDPFFNINEPGDLVEAEALLKLTGGPP